MLPTELVTYARYQITRHTHEEVKAKIMAGGWKAADADVVIMQADQMGLAVAVPTTSVLLANEIPAPSDTAAKIVLFITVMVLAAGAVMLVYANHRTRPSPAAADSTTQTNQFIK